MRFRLLCAALGAACLIATGLRPGALPFVPPAGFSDAAVSHFPAALFLRESVLERGEFPLWRETILGGQPFAANPLNKTAYPLQWLALVFPPALHLDVMIALHVLIAGWGVWRWSRALGLREEAAALSGLAYALAPRLIAHTGAGHLDVLYAMAWWSWLMWAVHGATAGRERSLTATLKLGLFAALVLLSDVRVSLFALSLAAAYGIYEAARSRRLRASIPLIGALVPFLLLTASVIAPLVGWQAYMSRGDLTAAGAGIEPMTPMQWSGLIALPVYAGNHELLAYVGLTVLVLAIIAVTSEPRRHLFFVIVIVFCALYALGSGGFLWSTLVRLFPPLLWFRVPSRSWLVIALIMPLLAGYGAERVLQWAEQRHTTRFRRRAQIFIVTLLFLSLVCGGAFLAAKLPLSANIKVGVTYMAGGAAFALVLLAAIRGRLRGQWLAAALVAVTFADLGWTSLTWLSWVGPEGWLTPYADLGAKLASEQPGRIYAPIYITQKNTYLSLPQEVAAVYKLRLFSGVDPFQVRGTSQAIERAANMPPAPYDVLVPRLWGPDDGQPATTPDTHLLAQWDVSHVVSHYPLESPRLEPDGQVDNAYVYRNLDYTPPPRTGVPAWPPDAPGLPDTATVERLNRLTLASAAVSGLTFVVIVAALGGTALRRRRSSLVVPAEAKLPA